MIQTLYLFLDGSMQQPKHFNELRNFLIQTPEDQTKKIFESFYLAQQKDVLLGFFFDRFSESEIFAVAHRQYDFFKHSLKIKQNTEIKSASQAHVKLAPILKGHFDRRAVLLKQTLESFKLSETVKKEWVSFEESFRKQVQSKNS